MVLKKLSAWVVVNYRNSKKTDTDDSNDAQRVAG
jgi:hypothetical protein